MSLTAVLAILCAHSVYESVFWFRATVYYVINAHIFVTWYRAAQIYDKGISLNIWLLFISYFIHLIFYEEFIK